MLRDSRAAFGIALLLCARGALAQGTIEVTETADADRILGMSECDGSAADGLTFAWSVAAPAAGDTYTLVASDMAGCPPQTSAAAPRNVVLVANITSARGSFPAVGSLSVPLLLSELGIQCNSAATAIFFCLHLSAASTRAASGLLILDLLVPAPPVALAAAPGEESLTISWAAGSGGPGPTAATDSYRITATSVDDPLDSHATVATGGGVSDAVVCGLRGETTYDVSVVALSPGGNRSVQSNTIQGTPARRVGTVTACEAPDAGTDGGTDGGVDAGTDAGTDRQVAAARITGGCATASGGVIALLGAALAVARALCARRRGGPERG